MRRSFFGTPSPENCDFRCSTFGFPLTPPIKGGNMLLVLWGGRSFWCSFQNWGPKKQASRPNGRPFGRNPTKNRPQKGDQHRHIQLDMAGHSFFLGMPFGRRGFTLPLVGDLIWRLGSWRVDSHVYKKPEKFESPSQSKPIGA